MSTIPLYIYCKALVSLIRLGLSLKGYPKASPDSTLHIPSRDKGRSIKIHVYNSTSTKTASTAASTPTPVLLNFHGSGFVLPLHGQDDAYCRRISRATRFTVLDVEYRRAPEDPFPAGLDDAEDVARYVLAHPQLYDAQRVALSGFSAGGNFALGLAGALDFPPGTFAALLAFYPPTDISIEPDQKVAPDTTGGRPIPPWLARLFNSSYFWRNVGMSVEKRRDPRVSPRFADPARFPARVLCVTCGWDNLAHEAEAWAAKLEGGEVEGLGVTREVVRTRVEKVSHAWDKEESLKDGGERYEEKERDRVYTLAEDMLNAVP